MAASGGRERRDHHQHPVALAVQAWWEGREDRLQERDYLVALRGELSEGLTLLPQSEMGFSQQKHGHEALIAQFHADELAPSDSLIYWLSGLAWPPFFRPPTAVMNDLISSGGIRLIESDTVRWFPGRAPTATSRSPAGPRRSPGGHPA